MTIYVDILFCVNLIIDYIILLSVKTFLSLNARNIRLILGAAVGALCSFVILLPPIPSGLSWVINFISACVVVFAAFSPMSKKLFLKTSAAFFLISFCYCGLMIAVWILFSPQNLVIRNGSVYIAVSPFILIVTTLFCYVILRVVLRITGRGVPKESVCRVLIEYKGHKKEFSGTIDTGNKLKEPFSGEYVIVARADIFSDISNIKEYMNFTDKYETNAETGIRLIPFNSVGGTGLMPAIKPDSLKIISGNEEIEVSAYLALCGGENITSDVQALVPAELIMKGS